MTYLEIGIVAVVVLLVLVILVARRPWWGVIDTYKNRDSESWRRTKRWRADKK